jgi:DNA-binding winged helix-turn-helix (wHTH) protein
LGRLGITVDGAPISLPPTNARLLLRFIASQGRPVTVERLYRDVWAPRAGYAVERTDRTSVQKRIGELRRILDPDRLGETSETIVNDRGATFAYRLDLESVAVDLWHAAELSREAATADAENAQRLAEQGLALWHGDPFEDVSGYRFAAAARTQAEEIRRALSRTLLDAYLKQDMLAEAQHLAESILAANPADDTVRTALQTAQARRSTNDQTLLTLMFREPRVAVQVVSGDLFAWPHDNLVIGFSDTFDTSTKDEMIISSNSAQGQLLRRIYRDDCERLDTALHHSLRAIPPVATEAPADKPNGKRQRYPIGTVAVLREGSRFVFCVAYSRMSNDLVARSSLRHLSQGLTELWRAAYRYGHFADLTMPLTGAGLSRIHEADHQELLEMVIRSFVDANRSLPICRLLRIVITPSQTHKIDTSALAESLRGLEEEQTRAAGFSLAPAPPATGEVVFYG